MPFSPSKSVQLALSPFSSLYGASITFRNFCYQKRIFRIEKLPRPAISVGNITIGGTGKTPVVQFLRDYFVQLNRTVVILTRGYGRKSRETIFINSSNLENYSVFQTGDEPRILAAGLKNGFVGIDADRVRAGNRALQKSEADLFILDDAFQHRRVHRDLDIVTLSARESFGNGKLIPAGRLREPLNQLQRADLFWITHVDHSEKNTASLAEELKIRFDKPVLLSRHTPEQVHSVDGELSHPVSFLQNKRVFAFCGIANPESFQYSLENLGCTVVNLTVFKDHHFYEEAQIEQILTQSNQTGAELVITTEKDAVRLGHLNEDWKNRIYYLKIGIKIVEGQKFFKKMFESMGLIS